MRAATVSARVTLATICSVLILPFAGSVVPAAAAAPGDLDASFGSNGSVVVEGTAGAQFHTQAPAKMALGPEGEILVLHANAPSCPEFNGCPVEWSLTRYDADGMRDPAFGTGPGSGLPVKGNEYDPADLAIGPDGKPVVAALDGGRVVLARFDRQGHLEAMLGAGDPNPLSGSTYEPPVVAVQSDGKVVVAVGHAEELDVVRYLANGERDAGFGSGGEATMTLGTRGHPAGLLLDSSGTISIAAPQCCGGSARYGEGFALARLLGDGQPDPGLAGRGETLLPTPGARGNVEAAALAPDGGAYIVFEVNTGTTATVGNVVKLRPDGSVDTAFGEEGFSRFPLSVDSLAVDGKGRLVAGGWIGTAAIARMRPGGGADRTFAAGTEGKLAASGPATGIALQSRGRIVALAEPCCGTTKSFSLFRLAGGTDHTRCFRHPATIVGTDGPDEIVGTPHRDVIAGLGGKDTIRGLAGPDLICGGKGRDKIFGGPGRDRIRP